MVDKRYFSIQEVSAITGISASKLRYAEKQIGSLSVKKVRNRRYYSIADIKELITYNKLDISIASIPSYLNAPLLPCPNKTANTSNAKSSTDYSPKLPSRETQNPQIIQDIDKLLIKFQNVVGNITHYSKSK